MKDVKTMELPMAFKSLVSIRWPIQITNFKVRLVSMLLYSHRFQFGGLLSHEGGVKLLQVFDDINKI